jgi:hypothetical protein
MIDQVLSKLPTATKTAGGWSARCPAHDDRRASLSVATGDDGRILLHCHAGCPVEKVVGALGLAMKDLGPTHAGKAESSPKGRIVQTYDYTDEEGRLLFQVCRMEPKGFLQRRSKPGGGWVWSVRGCRPVPYRLSELVKADPKRLVLIVEGEKDADRLAALGCIATTNAGGAGKWRPEYNEHFRGRYVIVFPDNDKPGWHHANQVALCLHGIAAAVKIVQLPGVPEKGDISDWLDAGGTLNQLREPITAAPLWQPDPEDLQPAKAGPESPKRKEPPPYVPFPTDALPAVPRDFIRQGATALGCDESFIALPLLAALASAVGNTRRIRLKRSWCEPCIVWAVIVGDSGTLKSPAFDLAMKPLRRLQSGAFREWEEAMATYRTDKATYDADLGEWKKKGRRKGEPPPEEPEEPVPVRYVCEDTTVEALAVLLQNQPRGLLLARDELAGWVNSFDAYKSCRGADVAHWLSMHRAGPMTVDRKSGKKLIHVPRASVSIAGGVQPRALGAALVGRYRPEGDGEPQAKADREHFDNGLAARLLFAMPPKIPKKWTEADLPRETEAAMETLFGRLLGLDFQQDEEGELQPIDVGLSAVGKAAWVRFYNDHAQEEAGLTGDLAAAWSKLEGYAARFALLVHLIRAASGDATLTDASAVDAESIAAGVLLSRWFGDEASRVYAIIGGDAESPEARERRELLRVIRDHGGRITVRELMQASRRFRTSAADAEAALDVLVKAGSGQWHQEDHAGGRGRPVAVFVLSDSGNGNTNSENPEETAIVLPLPPDNEAKTQAGDSPEEVAEWTG